MLSIICFVFLIIFLLALSEHVSGDLQNSPEGTKSNSNPAFNIVKKLPFIPFVDYGGRQTRQVLIGVVLLSFLGLVIGIALLVKSYRDIKNNLSPTIPLKEANNNS